MLICKEREKEQLPDDINALRALREEEMMNVHRLDSSNKEIEAALEEEDDEDLRQSIEENKEAIKTKLQRIAEIDAWVEKITRSRASVNQSAQRTTGNSTNPAGCVGDDSLTVLAELRKEQQQKQKVSEVGTGGMVSDFSGGLDL
mmetsp:Transcript_1444/g.3019  ORF Transcript_1444/g.3019 Transcript_1444/m.3019 type:complete len:145 (+) Transcript_1444:82-516(+)